MAAKEKGMSPGTCLGKLRAEVFRENNYRTWENSSLRETSQPLRQLSPFCCACPSRHHTEQLHCGKSCKRDLVKNSSLYPGFIVTGHKRGQVVGMGRQEDLRDRLSRELAAYPGQLPAGSVALQAAVIHPWFIMQE